MLEVWHAKQLAIQKDQSIVTKQTRNKFSKEESSKGVKVITSDKNDGNRLMVAFEGGAIA